MTPRLYNRIILIITQKFKNCKLFLIHFLHSSDGLRFIKISNSKTAILVPWNINKFTISLLAPLDAKLSNRARRSQSNLVYEIATLPMVARNDRCKDASVTRH